jgi:hypothetical protein
MSTPPNPAPPRIGYIASGPFGLNTTNVDPPMPLYIRKDEILQLKVWNSVSGATVTISWKMLMADGQVIDSSYTKTPTSARAVNTYSFPMEEGYLLTVIVTGGGSTLIRGQLFAQVQTGRGNTSGMQTATALLLQDYVTTTLCAAWPTGAIRSSVEGPGRIFSASVTNPAAGADWSVSVPSGARWQVRQVAATLTTSASAGNRVPRLTFTDNANNVGSCPMQSLSSTSFTYNLVWGQGYPNVAANVVAAVQTAVWEAIPLTLSLLSGDTMGPSTAGLLVGDQWSAITYLVEEWIDV